ncbi:MAG: hydroxymethylglutaryl-coenzyme A synthase family protein [Chloroflexi bacterium]|nr:MAG: hydroxymethylglutaryl-coenzyme A synthase family protein [Chloroflexota bacterium]MBA4376507.1 hydroxymethylglutaryl-CoA synthase [Anaerolinea sp.]
MTQLTSSDADNLLLRTDRKTGIIGYGAYVPRYRLPGSEVSRVWTGGKGGSPVKEKSVAGLDEDVVTMSIEAARNALARAGIEPCELRAVWVGSESHPYAVKPSGTVVAEAIGASHNIQSGDWEFACKAGTEAMVAATALVGSGMAKYALAIGMDTAQGKPGDALEYTASSGGAAFVIGPAEEAAVLIEASYSYVSDTPDFWRRPEQKYPEHGQRFTGEPAYFKHVETAGRVMLQQMKRTPADYNYVVFHQPNPKFPQKAGATLGFTPEQIKPGLLVSTIGNTYAGASLIGLTAVLDIAKPGDKILMVSYGSGAGSDAFSLVVTDKITARRGLAPSTADYIARRTQIDYAMYTRFRDKIDMG